MEKQTRRGKREGSIYQRKDGRWVAAVTLESGKRKYFYAKTEQEARQWLQTSRNHGQGDHSPDALLIVLTALPFQRYCRGLLASANATIQRGSDMYESHDEAAQILYPFTLGEQQGDVGDYVVKGSNGIEIVGREIFETSHHLMKSNHKEHGE